MSLILETKMTNKPYQDTRLAKYLTTRVLELRPKTQADIAVEAVFVNENMLTMLKQGREQAGC
jgi:hypothetical protein